jgi:hypothetical protein
MIYLADWYHTVLTGRRLTEINWSFDHYGPYVKDVFESLRLDSRFKVEHSTNLYGKKKEVVTLVADVPRKWELQADEKESLDIVISKCKKLNWNAFIELIYSTYPIQESDRHSTIDLSALAGKFSRSCK